MDSTSNSNTQLRSSNTFLLDFASKWIGGLYTHLGTLGSLSLFVVCASACVCVCLCDFLQRVMDGQGDFQEVHHEAGLNVDEEEEEPKLTDVDLVECVFKVSNLGRALRADFTELLTDSGQFTVANVQAADWTFAEFKRLIGDIVGDELQFSNVTISRMLQRARMCTYQSLVGYRFLSG